MANYWAGFNTKTRKAVWTVDHFMADGDEAVIEGTMISPFLTEGRKEMLRGVEWYVFHLEVVYYALTSDQFKPGDSFFRVSETK